MEKRRRKIVLIAAVCMVIIAALLLVSCSSNKNVYLRITNQSDGEIYKYWVNYSYLGNVGRSAESSIGISNPIPGSNTRKGIGIGESVKLEMEPNPNYVTQTPENLTIELYVFDKPIKSQEDQELENSVKVGEALTFPVEVGKCAELVVTGNREEGFKMEVTGWSD